MKLIIYAHPKQDGCHNALVLEKVKTLLDDYEIIDLYRDGFDPVLPARDLESNTTDPLVKSYQEKISRADSMIIINPVYWYSAPAILKGFFDRVFEKDFAFNFRKMPKMNPVAEFLLNLIMSVRFLYPVFSSRIPIDQKLKGKKALVINTYGGAEAGYKLFGDAPRYSMDCSVLNFCGIETRRLNWFNARAPGMPEEIERKIESELRKLG